MASLPVVNVVQVAESLVATSSRGAAHCCSAADAGGREGESTKFHLGVHEFTNQQVDLMNKNCIR